MSLLDSRYPAKTKRNPAYYRDKIYSLSGLPTLPEIASEIMQMTRNDKLSVRQMVPIIDKDPSLAMKILKIANSAFYGFEEKLESLRQAVVMIGTDELTNLAVGFSVIKALTINNGNNHVDWKNFWQHSIGTGHIAEILNGELKTSLPTSPYSLGLLHDIGKLVLYRLDSVLYVDALKYAQKKKCSSFEAETEMFGLTHMDAGALIAKKWKLPEAVRYAIGYHHNPSETPNPNFRSIAALIQLADIVSNINGISFGIQVDPASIDPESAMGWTVLQSEYDHLIGVDINSVVTDLDDNIEVIMSMVQIFEG